MTIAIDPKKLREQELFIATPMYGAMCTGPYVESLMEYAVLCRKYDLHYILRFHYNESLIQRARNYLVDEFLQTSATHMMFIDADIKFEALDILTLQALAHKTDKHVICGIYPKKQLQWDKVKKAVEKGLVDNPDELAFFGTSFAFNLVPGTPDFDIAKPIEIMEGATGFMMVQRRVFEEFAKKYPETLYTTDDTTRKDRKINAFFDCKIDPKTNRYLSEDYCFSQMVRAIGLKVWMCPWMQLGHQGNFLFQGDLRAISAIETSLS